MQLAAGCEPNSRDTGRHAAGQATRIAPVLQALHSLVQEPGRRPLADASAVARHASPHLGVPVG